MDSPIGFCISGYFDGLETFMSNNSFEIFRRKVNANYGKSYIKKIWVLDTQDFTFSEDLFLKCSRVLIGNEIFFGFNSFKKVFDAEKRGAYISYMIVIKNMTAKTESVNNLLCEIENYFERCLINNIVEKKLINENLYIAIEKLLNSYEPLLDLQEIDFPNNKISFRNSMVTCREFFEFEYVFFDLVYSLNDKIVDSMDFTCVNHINEIMNTNSYIFLNQEAVNEIIENTERYQKNLSVTSTERLPKPETITIEKSNYTQLLQKISNLENQINEQVNLKADFEKVLLMKNSYIYKFISVRQDFLFCA